MNLKQIRDLFFSELSGLYNTNELNKIFFTLIEEYTGLKHVDIIANDVTFNSQLLEKQLEDAIQKLRNYEPVQYILGKTRFYDLELNVSPDVLIPRPETEELTDIIIKDYQSYKFEKSYKSYELKIIDIGTGSGCIAIALKKNLPLSEVYAIDISDKALLIAKTNAEKNNVNIQFSNADINNTESLKHLPAFNIIVSNPPYVRNSEKSALLPNVLNFEPHQALFVNDYNPLLYYEGIIKFALDKHLLTDGKVYLEINENLSQELINLLEYKRFKNITLKYDLFDKPRFIICNK